MSDKDRELDMEFVKLDKYKLPKNVQQVEEDEEAEVFYHTNQRYLAKVL